jgi:hypothetical protein
LFIELATTKSPKAMTTTTASISGITKVSNTDIEFVSNGRLYCLIIDQEELDRAYGQTASYSENPMTGRGYTDTNSEVPVRVWEKLELSNEDLLEVIQANQVSWEDVTECTDRGQALLAETAKEAKKQARHKLLSWIVSGANKLRSTLKSMSLAMHVAWTKARILASGVVNFVKVDDVDADGEIEIQSRRVADGGRGKNGLLLFTDLDKYETYLKAGLDEATAKAKSFISMHVWQVVSWSY